MKWQQKDIPTFEVRKKYNKQKMNKVFSNRMYTVSLYIILFFLLFTFVFSLSRPLSLIVWTRGMNYKVVRFHAKIVVLYRHHSRAQL